MSADRRVITPVARLSYPHLFERATPFPGQEPKFQCELIFEKGADLSVLEAAVKAAVAERWGTKAPKGLNLPFREGNAARAGKDGYGDCIFIGAKSKDRPGVVVGPERRPPEDPTEVYGGCYVRASVTAFSYDMSGKKGVSFALNNVWKLRDGDPFGSFQSAENEFSSVVCTDEDAFGVMGDDDSLI